MILDLAMDLVSSLPDQKKATADQDNIAPREGLAMHEQHWLGESDEPYQQAQQHDAEHECKREPDPARACRLGLRNPRDDHRNEDDVVDAKHDLERTQRQQRRPCLGTEEEFDHALKDLSRRI